MMKKTLYVLIHFTFERERPVSFGIISMEHDLPPLAFNVAAYILVLCPAHVHLQARETSPMNQIEFLRPSTKM